MPEQLPDPNVCRRKLRSELRRLRERTPVTQQAVADEMSWSVSKVIRIESGEVTISVTDLKALLQFYGLQDETAIDGLLSLAKRARQRTWLNQYRDVASQQYLAYLGYEQSAIRSYNFQPTLIPGLLQTEEYASEVLRVVIGGPSRKSDGLTELRMARQDRSLARTDLESYFLIDESVVRRLVGSSTIMRQQISRLIELNQSPNISIHVVPFKFGFYKGFRLPYVVFVFPDPEEEAILYLEDPHREAIIREDTTPEESESSDVAIQTPPTYLSVFLELWNQTSLEETSTILESALDQFNS